MMTLYTAMFVFAEGPSVYTIRTEPHEKIHPKIQEMATLILKGPDPSMALKDRWDMCSPTCRLPTSQEQLLHWLIATPKERETMILSNEI